jgi:hypothetical protein
MLPADPRRRLFLLCAALAVAAVPAGWSLLHSGPARPLPLYDFVSFWAAGRLNQQGLDPYDTDRLAALEREAEPRAGQVLVMWPAPWALTLLGPVSRLGPQVAYRVWALLLLAVLLFAADRAWLLAGGARERRGVALLVVFLFLPSYMVLVTGQLGPLLLLGLVGFLHFHRRGCDGAAGACLVLTAIKPQLTLLFWLALLLWAVDRRAWRLVVGGVVGAALLLACPLWDNPHLLQHYWHSLTGRTPTHSHPSPLLGTGLRALFGWQHFWLQFVPLVPGLVWLAWYWRRHRRDWDWGRQLGPLLFASFLVAPYGAWPFDLVVLLLPLLQATAGATEAGRRPAALAAAGFAAVNLLALAQLLGEAQYFWFLWLTPALLLAWALTRRWCPGPAVCPS